MVMIVRLRREVIGERKQKVSNTVIYYQAAGLSAELGYPCSGDSKEKCTAALS